MNRAFCEAMAAAFRREADGLRMIVANPKQAYIALGKAADQKADAYTALAVEFPLPMASTFRGSRGDG